MEGGREGRQEGGRERGREREKGEYESESRQRKTTHYIERCDYPNDH